MNMDWEAAIYTYLGASFIVALLARFRNKSPVAWIFISIFLSPLLASLILIFSNTEVNIEPKKKLTYTGQDDLENDSYKIYLTEKYVIIKNDVLSKYVLGEQLFESVDEALLKAHQLELKSKAIVLAKLNKRGGLDCPKCGGFNDAQDAECRYCKYPLLIES